MQISRRDLLRSSAVVAGATAAGGLGLAEEAVAGTVAPLRATTRSHTLLKGDPGAGGYRPVVRGPGEPYVGRSELGARAARGRANSAWAGEAFATWD